MTLHIASGANMSRAAMRRRAGSARARASFAQAWRIPLTTTSHAAFRGCVQGVGFRAFVGDVAIRHQLQGWVRNRRDGSVEAVFAGAAEAVEAAIAACRKGPLHGRVDDAEVREGTPGELALRRDRNGFAVLPTV